MLQVQLQVRQVPHLMVAEVQVTITHQVEHLEVMGLEGAEGVTEGLVVKVVTAEGAMGEVAMAALEEVMEVLAAVVEAVIHMDHPEVAVEVMTDKVVEEVMVTAQVVVEAMEVDVEVVEDLEVVVEEAVEEAMVEAEEVEEDMVVMTKSNPTTKFTLLAFQKT